MPTKLVDGVQVKQKRDSEEMNTDNLFIAQSLFIHLVVKRFNYVTLPLEHTELRHTQRAGALPRGGLGWKRPPHFLREGVSVIE